MSKITYENKVAINEEEEIADINKVTASDLNSIKKGINDLISVLGLDTDTWVSGTTYSIGTQVIHNNILYECTTANSDIEFTVSNWEIVSIIIGKYMINNKLLNDDLKQLFIDLVFPVGSIYTSMENTNPETLFGGKWTQITNRFLYCTTSSKTTGGQNSVSYTPAGKNTGGAVQSHTLTIGEIPAHNHEFELDFYNYQSNGYGFNGQVYKTSSIIQKGAIGTNVTGGGKGHSHNFTQPTFTGTASTINTMPQYITCYAWYRTA